MWVHIDLPVFLKISEMFPLVHCLMVFVSLCRKGTQVIKTPLHFLWSSVKTKCSRVKWVTSTTQAFAGELPKSNLCHWQMRQQNSTHDVSWRNVNFNQLHRFTSDIDCKNKLWLLRGPNVSQRSITPAVRSVSDPPLCYMLHCYAIHHRSQLHQANIMSSTFKRNFVSRSSPPPCTPESLRNDFEFPLSVSGSAGQQDLFELSEVFSLSSSKQAGPNFAELLSQFVLSEIFSLNKWSHVRAQIVQNTTSCTKLNAHKHKDCFTKRTEWTNHEVERQLLVWAKMLEDESLFGQMNKQSNGVKQQNYQMVLTSALNFSTDMKNGNQATKNICVDIFICMLPDWVDTNLLFPTAKTKAIYFNSTSLQHEAQKAVDPIFFNIWFELWKAKALRKKSSLCDPAHMGFSIDTGSKDSNFNLVT